MNRSSWFPLFGRLSAHDPKRMGLCVHGQLCPAWKVLDRLVAALLGIHRAQDLNLGRRPNVLWLFHAGTMSKMERGALV